MLIRDLGEWGILRRLRKEMPEYGKEVLVGFGDDGAVFSIRHGKKVVFSSDAMAEGVHFDLRYTPPESLGWKAMVSAVSDILAMGGMPLYTLVSIGLPDSWRVEDLDAVYRGLKRCGKSYRCPVIGGDTVCSKAVFISVAVVGEVEQQHVATRGGAKKGDILCVTGSLGGARTGLEVLKSGKDKDRFQDSIYRFLEPVPPGHMARELVTGLGVTSMIDISDGLISEAFHLCEESGLGCRFFGERIPVFPQAQEWCKQEGVLVLDFAMNSGEEYELLFTADPRRFREWESHWDETRGTFPVVIGEMCEAGRMSLVIEGQETPLTLSGWDHFKT